MDIYYRMKWSLLSQPNQEHNLATVFYTVMESEEFWQDKCSLLMEEWC